MTYQNFWDWFQENEKTFFNVVEQGNSIPELFFNKLASKLDIIKEGIWYLSGMYDIETAEIIFTADSDLKTIAFVEELVAAAPDIKRWRITALKPEMDIDRYSIEMEGISFSNDTLFFYPNESTEYPDQIDITMVHKDYSDEKKNSIINGSYIFLDNYLGEITSATIIDNVCIESVDDAQKELIPIEKLKSYLIWREKEFIEKNDKVVPDVEEAFSVYEGKMNDGSYYIGTLNSNLLAWQYKASHPWFVVIKLEFDSENGLPDDAMAEKLNYFEDNLLELLTSKNGNLYLGRETNNGRREIYFACRDFRNASKVLYQTQKKHLLTEDFTYEIYKDKYWTTVKHYMG